MTTLYDELFSPQGGHVIWHDGHSLAVAKDNYGQYWVRTNYAYYRKSPDDDWISASPISVEYDAALDKCYETKQDIYHRSTDSLGALIAILGSQVPDCLVETFKNFDKHLKEFPFSNDDYPPDTGPEDLALPS